MLRLVCVALLLMGALKAWATDYVVLVQGKAAGHLKVAAAPDGSVKADYSFRDNGRGPDIDERFRLDAAGVPVSYEVNGKTAFGAATEESYRREGGRARWKSRSDQGDEAAGDDYLFVPLDGTFAYYEAALRHLLRRGETGAPTYRGMTLKAARSTRVTLTGSSGPVAVVLVTLTGIDTSPWYFWLRDDGTDAFFAAVWPGWSIVETGHESLVPQLLERKREAVEAREAQLRRELAIPLPGVTLVRAVRWFDAPAARMRGPSDVWLFDGKIGALTAPGQLKSRPDRVIDGRGRTLLPGLWDMHVHTWDGVGLFCLSAGVTSVRDPGGDNAAVHRLKSRIEGGDVIGPSVHAAGLIEGESPYSLRRGIVVDSLQAALDAVDWYAARGVRMLKLYNSIKPEWVKPMAARAHALGLHVSGHVPAFMRAEQAVRDGYDELTHANQVMLNFVARPGDDTRTLVRFERVGSDARSLDLRGAKARAFIRLLRERRTVVDPTLAVFEPMFTQAQGEPNPAANGVADHLPVQWQRSLRVADMDLEGPKLLAYRESYRRMVELTVALHDAGVTLVAGTDGWSGLGLHRELEIYVKGGIPPLQVLRIATWNGARVAGASAERGRIERGYVADLVLVEGDPSTDITALRRASLVIQGRTAYAPDRLYTAMGFKPFVPAAKIESATH